MPEQQIPLIMEFIDKIVSPDDRKRKSSDGQILKILALLQVFSISNRSAGIFFINYQEYIRMIDLHEINRDIDIDLKRKYTSPYSLRWEIDRKFSILE